MLIPVAAAFAVMAAPGTGQQFDLICTSTMTGVGSLASLNTTTTNHFRVDLDQQVWCQDECVRTEPIESVNAAELVFLDNHTPDINAILTVSRTNGVLYHLVDFVGLGTKAVKHGTCVKADFSGMPEQQF